MAATQVSYVRTPWEALHMAPRPTRPITLAYGAVSREQAAWIGRLEQCESRGNPAAVNPRDLDGTPSYGLLQFKPSTFAMFARVYGIESTDYMDPRAQRAIVERMLGDRHVNWHQQFPACVEKLGLPPGRAV